MTVQETDQDPSQQIEAASKAFEHEFERFARFIAEANGLAGLSLEQSIAEERSLTELRTRHLGKKSALAASKKLIGKVPSDQRAAFGQRVQSVEATLVGKIDAAELCLKQFIELQRTARESIDVTLPGRRPPH